MLNRLTQITQAPQPNTPVNPGQPDSPRWPATVHDLDNKESVSRTIHYVYEDGSKAKDDVVETLNFKRWSRINLVTGQIFFQDWTTNDDTFDKVVSPTTPVTQRINQKSQL